MQPSLVVAIGDAHDSVVPLIRTIPDAALGWQPSSDAWSLKQIISHLAHANDFYVMIVDQARATRFGTVQLHPNLVGWQQMVATDAAVAACTTTLAVLDCFEHTYQSMLKLLADIQAKELDQPFIFWPPDKQPYTTALRQRVIQLAAEHMREHQVHLSETLTLWQTTEVAL